MKLWATVFLFLAGQAFLPMEPGPVLNSCVDVGNEDPEYLSLPTEDQSPHPRVVRISREGNVELIRIELSEVSSADNARRRTKTLTSRDGGKTWSKAIASQENPYLNSESDSVIYKYAENGLLERSRDKGKTWSVCKFTIEGLTTSDFGRTIAKGVDAKVVFHFVTAKPNDPSRIYGSFSVVIPSATNPQMNGKRIEVPGIFSSVDAGDNWTIFAPDLYGFRADERSTLGIDPTNPQRMLGHGSFGIVMTKDGGRSWVPVGQQAALERPVKIKGRQDSSEAGLPDIAYLQVAQISFNQNGGVFLLTNKGLYVTKDEGRSWCHFYCDGPRLFDFHSLYFDPLNSHRLFIGTLNSILVSDDDGFSFRRFFDARKGN